MTDNADKVYGTRLITLIKSMYMTDNADEVHGTGQITLFKSMVWD